MDESQRYVILTLPSIFILVKIMDYKKRIESLKLCLNHAKTKVRAAPTVEAKRQYFEKVRDIQAELDEVKKAANA